MISLIVAATFGGAVVFAAQSPSQTAGSASPQSSSFQLVSCNPTIDPSGQFVQGTECDYSQLIATATRIIMFVLYILTPLVIGMILYAGFKYMMAGSDARLLEDAKKMFKPILIGVFFIFAAWLIVYTILNGLLASQIGDVKKTDIIPTTPNSTQ
ncbi:MAG: hypothetical protein KGI79_00860 [Patescibacteria group bacterium]|nr:hypothetical protein [Patescibacteria group bacterium]